ncbi:protein adenylyltransferase SelO family protein [Sulfurimonas sp. HSL-3221]|uniref:protein adenylyltransferase SelO family protein n=1 Tax=Thiomicrolovo sulfuroxydans TaxID=2894755 RepID=UPI001E634421|nr:protein adenylyltransferase SelO family protein [Sulfurimonas sp. HSL-3221]UFS63039.1 protein adenylyltransferase SelO family protein [Sulfurimonas sp. HSL-3221]
MKATFENPTAVKSLDDLAALADYSLMDTLTSDPEATADGVDHAPRQVFSGHYVPVNPTPIETPVYIAHSETFFRELGFSDALATSEEFMRMFTGDSSQLPEPLRRRGWATGYALSIYGTEYYEQCPFRTGNGYGDGRAVSILEAVIKGQRWEMQLKGGGRTPYCRGADGRAVLRSSIREFLAQEHMHALGVKTSRSLSLYTSQTETVARPWFNNGSYSRNPEVMLEEAVAITTRVAPSFIRVGQVELFGRRARKNEHPKALEELEQIVLHLCEREYSDTIDATLPLRDKVLLLATAFRDRLTTLVAEWIRVGYCQGNFNSDNTAAGGFTLDYGPFGFIEMFDPRYQPWTGGGDHFSFLNQPQAAETNFAMFCSALKPLLAADEKAVNELDMLTLRFARAMQGKMIPMWASKLGLRKLDAPLFNELITLMLETGVDYTIFFRELSSVPEDIAPLTKSFYGDGVKDAALLNRWSEWLEKWKSVVQATNPDDINAASPESREALSRQMKAVNPKYTLREWFLVPAYQQAADGDYTLIKELQAVMTDPYAEQSEAVAAKYYRKKPTEYFEIAGISHVTCSS